MTAGLSVIEMTDWRFFEYADTMQLDAVNYQVIFVIIL
jgi:hypothetical protein